MGTAHDFDDRVDNWMLNAIIVHWQAPDWCADAVRAFLASTGVELSLTVVNNGGTLALPEEVRVVETDHNLGYAGGANLALREWLDDDRGDFCIVASHDCEPEPNALAELLSAATRHPVFGLLAPCFTDGEYGGRLLGRTPGLREQEWLSGSCLLLRRQCIVDIGLFDERMGSYSEDADLSLRARDRGWWVGTVETARATTKGSSLSIVERRRLGEANAIYLHLKRGEHLRAVLRGMGQLVAAARHALIGLLLVGRRGTTHRRLVAAHLSAIRLGVSKARRHGRARQG